MSDFQPIYAKGVTQQSPGLRAIASYPEFDEMMHHYPNGVKHKFFVVCNPFRVEVIKRTGTQGMSPRRQTLGFVVLRRWRI
jgi:hypothetical protein